MKVLKSLTVGLFTLALMATPLIAAEDTCCQKAAAAGKEDCAHKCCIEAHKKGESCAKCNPNKEDAKLIKSPKDGEKKPDAPK